MAARVGQLTVQQACDILGVTEGYMRRILGNGSFPGVKFGDQWAIDPADVEQRRAMIGRRSKRAMEAAQKRSKARRK